MGSFLIGRIIRTDDVHYQTQTELRSNTAIIARHIYCCSHK